MKFTLSWLKSHLDTDASVDAIAQRLTMLGLEIEEVIDRAAGLESFVVGHVIATRPHPDADKLRLCTVDTGGATQEVVCGAPNARTGLKGVFAAAGSFIPGLGITLKKAKIRGIESNGMLLSEREMGLSGAHEGIVELPEDAPVGARAVDVMGLADPVIDIAITPNRGDCLGVRGVARDLAAAGEGSLRPLDAKPVSGSFASPIVVRLDFDESSRDACPYFVGRFIRGVRNGDSPQWLKDRLIAVGLRPISALVDITNYISYDLCRPLHVFDAKRLQGDIHVRLAREGETLAALDGGSHVMDATMTVIADDAQALALAGIMGGEASGCTAETTDVFLEVAYFDPIRTAATGRKLNLQSDARYRFERGVDPAFLVDAGEIATRLILELCGGIASEPVVAGAEPQWRRQYRLRLGRVQALGGVDVPPAEQERILDALGCTLGRDGFELVVTPPSWRPDILGEADLVEEILRIHGFANIPVVPMERPSSLPTPALGADQRRHGAARRVLAGRGLVEAVTYSFLPSAQALLFGGDAEALRLSNPISADLDVMRPSILPNLITAVGRNDDRGLRDAALFEVGPHFAGTRPEDEALVAGGVRSGRTGHRNWASPPRAVDLFDAKADVLALLTALGAPGDTLKVTADAPDWYHPGRSGTLRLGPKTVLAQFGEIHPQVLTALGVRGPVVGFEVFVDALPRRKAKGTTRPLLTLSAYQPVERDFAFVVDEAVAAQDLQAAARNADKTLIVDVRVFDLFVGESLGPGRKSLAINVVMQPMERTLVEADLDEVAEKVVANVAKATGGVLRA